jgi:hypothetical protein
VFTAPALGRLIRGRVRPLISPTHPAPNQVPRLVRAAHPRLVPQLQFVEAPSGSQAERSQQKVSNRSSRGATRAPVTATHEHATAPVDIDHHALRAFGTKRPWVRIPPPRQSEIAGQEPMLAGFCSVSVSPASKIAERVGRSRQSVALLARGERGPGGFPTPVARRYSSNPLWNWSQVEAWFERYEPEAVPAHGPRLSPDFLAEVNDRLDLRERLRHSPHAPWRPKLNEALPLGH